MPKHYKAILDIVKADQLTLFDKEKNDKIIAGETPLDANAKYGDVKRAVWENKLTDEDYVNILLGRFKNFDIDDALRSRWADPNNPSATIEDSMQGYKHFLNLKNNKPEVNEELLRQVSQKINRGESGGSTSSERSHARALKYSLEYLTNHSNLNEKSIKSFIDGAYYPKSRLDQRAKIFNNPNFSKKMLHYAIEKDNNYFTKAMQANVLDKQDINHFMSNPNFIEKQDRSSLNSYINKTLLNTTDDEGNVQQAEGVPPNIARLILDSKHGENLANNHLDHLLGKLNDNERKSWVDKALGIEGGEYFEEKEDKTDEEWEDTNWDNWVKGGSARDNIQRYLAGSKWLTDDQAEHIKRHGDFDHKYELYHNANIDPRHGIEMFRKWHDDDEHHNYDARDLNDHHKTWVDDIYTQDDLDPDLLDEVREEIEQDDSGELRDSVESNYSFSEWIYENSEKIASEIDADDYIDEIHDKLHEDHDWEGENPNFNEYMDGLIENIAEAAENDDVEDEEGNFVDHPDGMVRKKHWEQFLPEMRQNVPKNLVNDFEEFVAHNLNDDDDEMDADDFRSYFQNDIDGINPRTIDFSNHDDFTIDEHPEYDQRFKEAKDSHMEDIVRERPYDFYDSFYEDYWDSDSYRERYQEEVDERFEEALGEHFQELYEDSHQDHRFIPEHLRQHLPEYEELKAKFKSRKSDGGHRRFLDNRIKDREYEHAYGDDQHLHEMIKDYSDANGGSIDMGKMIKIFPNLKDGIKKVFSGKGKLSSEQIQEKIDSIPKTKYDISYGQWASGKMQNLNNQNQALIRLDHSDESMKPIVENADIYNTFKKVQNVSRQSGHPTKDNTIAWARVDMSDPEHWMIDELQSDFGKTVTRYLKDKGHDDKAAHIEKISDLHKNWREAMINHIIKEAKKHGVKKVSTHSPESKHKHAGYDKNIHTVYKDSYKKVPRKMGFKESNFRDLPLTDSGKKYFDDGNTEVFDKKLEGHNEAYDHHVGYAAHHYDAASKHEEGSDYNITHMNMAEKHLDYAHSHSDVLRNMGKNDVDVDSDINNYRLSDELQNSIRTQARTGNFKSHDYDDEIHSKIVENSKGHSGHTYEIQPQILKKHLEIVEYFESLEKGELKQAAKGLALSVALMNAAHYIGESNSVSNTKQTYENTRTLAAQEAKPDPVSDAYEKARAEGDEIIKRNQKNWFLDNKATTMSPIVYKQTIKNNLELNEKYGHTLKYSNRTFRDVIEKNPHLRNDIHGAHFDKLHGEFEGNLDKIQHAWENGIKATHKKFSNNESVNHTDKRINSKYTDSSIKKEEVNIGPQLNTTGEKPQTHSDFIRSVADSYAQSKGLTLNHSLPKAKVNPEHAAKIADTFSNLKHDPSHPEVQNSYNALIQETTDQFNHIVNNTGLKISKITPDMKNPYKNSKEVFKDIHENNHLWFYPTEIGYGSGDGDQGIEHPMLQNTDIHHEGQPLLANDLFRIVHDYFGHAKEGNGFGANGEENAWMHHKQMYSPLAAKALTAETKMQNSWVNFGPHGEHNRKNPAQTIYADQKAAIAPDWVVDHAHPETMEKSEDLMKGSLQRRNPFNPMSTSVQQTRDLQRGWTHDEYESAKKAIKPMSKFAKLRAMNKLSGNTKVTRHPETGERMFLMHRGASDEEFGEFSDAVTLQYPKGHRNSWTPDINIANSFGEDTVSAWIPESKLIHSVNQFNIPTKEYVDKVRRKKQDGSIKHYNPDFQSRTEKEEQEWIVEHDGNHIYHANPEAINFNTVNDKINRRGINKNEDDKNKGLKNIIHEQKMWSESGRPMPLDDVDDSHDPIKEKKEDQKVKETMEQLKTDTPNPSKMFQRVYSVPSEEKMKRSKKAAKSGQVPSSINVYGSHFPVVKIINDNTLLLHTSDYGKQGKTREIVDKIRKELPDQFPDFKVVEIHHPDYRHSSKIMRLRNKNGLKNFLKDASINHPNEEYRNHVLDALNHLNSIKKGEYTKPIHAKRTEAEGWDYDKNLKIRMDRINGYLQSVGLTPDASAGKKRDLGASSPTSVNINTEGDPEDQQMLHEGAHAMQTPEGVSLEDYQYGIGEPGFKGKLHQSKHRKELKEAHGGGMPEQAAQQMEGMIARRSGVEPFRSPQRGAGAKNEVERSRQHAKNQMKMFDEGIYRFDPFTGENELQGNINAYINAKKMGNKDLAERIRQKLHSHIKNKKELKAQGFTEDDFF